MLPRKGNQQSTFYFVVGCEEENRKERICSLLRELVRYKNIVNLEKLTVIGKEVGHAKLSPDAGFGVICRCEKTFDTDIPYDIVDLINSSIPDTGRNDGM